MSDKTKQGEALKRELQDRSNDEIKVFNPSSEDYHIKAGGNSWTVPNRDKDIGYGKGYLVAPRCVTDLYRTHKIDELINQESEKLLSNAKNKYRGTRWPEEELRIALRTNNPELRKKYMKQLIVGVVRRFGGELPRMIDEPKSHDDRSLDIQLAEELGEVELEGELHIPQKVKQDTLEQDISI